MTPSLASRARSLWQGEPGAARTPLWLDCDTGHDDAFALLVAAHAPCLDLLGISTTHGNAPLEQTTANTLSILTAISRTSIAVYPGSSHPICRSPCFAPDIHGSSGLDGTTCLPPPSTSPVPTPSAIQSAYSALISTPPNTAYIIATGTLTNIALLFLTYPSLASHIRGLHIMGGAIGSSFTTAPLGTISASPSSAPTASPAESRFGNWTPYAEFNIYADPEAAASVFRNPILASKIMLAPLDLSHLFLATSDIQHSLLHGFDGPVTAPAPAPVSVSVSPDAQPSKVRTLFNEILTFFATTYADVFGLTDGPPLHDVLPVLAVLAPGIFDDKDGERFEVEVVIDGAHGTDGVARTESRVGQTVVRPVGKGGQGGVRIPRAVEGEVAWRIVDLCLGEAERVATW
ncbi:hypothetical protein CAC42_5614 [Sphaceloma murrayae]|uniref:Inosine/uridine-preferring nucleoside hydrolase domain-containing protein n=1 Tax=Sphaceloma murrayae TaxID=2082308 RepID=A0A2K1QYN2_9PEZI|nr:hypothetical protein CAC42_5614 [Sphaceloma murrayae]